MSAFNTQASRHQGIEASRTDASGIDFTPPVTGEAALKRLRSERKTQRLLRDLAAGKWRNIILDAAQGKYPVVRQQSGKMEALLVKLNVIGPAMEMHADVLAGEPSSVTAPKGNEPQQLAINAIKARCLWDALLHQACELVNVEGTAAVRVGVDELTRRVTLSIEDNEVCFPTGRLGSDQQPTAWERRWVIEIADPNDPKKTINVLRVESHFVPAGSEVGVVVQRAYKVESSDPLGTDVSDAAKAKPFDLATVAPGAVEVTQLPSAELDIVQLVIGRRPVGGSASAPARTRINENDLDVLDAMTAQVSRVMRTMERHGDPRMRVTENMLDNKGGFDSAATVLVDPDKIADYIKFEGQFEEMLAVLDKIVDHVLMVLRMARPLLGMGVKDGAVPSTFGELRLNSQTTLTAARAASVYIASALERVWTLATVMEARQPGGGFDVAPVNVRLSVGLFQSFGDRVAEQNEALLAGLTSLRRAVAAVHGDENAEAVLAEMQSDADRKADLAAKSLMVEVGSAGAGGESDGAAGGDGSNLNAGGVA